MRHFDTGATRSLLGEKLGYVGFLSPQVLKRFAEYMHQHRTQEDGQLREPGNWKKGMPLDCYVDSGVRHMIDWWRAYDEGRLAECDELACAILFNVQGYLHERLKT
jgi:hypothetical protein